MIKFSVQYCEQCAKEILKGWKGWPHKNPVPILPKIIDGKCEECAGTISLQPSRIIWYNYHGEYNTGLPDYWLLVIHGDRTKWGQPYFDECLCPKCGRTAIVSEMNYPNGTFEFKSNCVFCGVFDVEET